MRKGKLKDEAKKKKRGVKCNMKQSLCWVLVLASCGCGERRQASVQRTESRLWKTNMLTQTHDVPQKLRAVSCSHNTNIQKQEVKIQVDSLRHVRFLFLLLRKKKIRLCCSQCLHSAAFVQKSISLKQCIFHDAPIDHHVNKGQSDDHGVLTENVLWTNWLLLSNFFSFFS